MASKLDDLQAHAVKFGRREKTWALTFEMGLGKTKTAINWADQSGFKRIAILGRFDDLATWEDELRTYAPHFDFFNICLKKKAGWRSLALALAVESEYRVILITYDAVKQLWPQVKAIAWDAVIADEMTEIKHPRTTRTKAVLDCFVPSVKHRLGLTGTPITNSPLDVFTQMYFVDGGQRLGDNWYSFRKRFFWPEPMGHKWHIFPEKMKLLRRLINEKFLRAKKVDVLDLPPKIYMKKTCPLTDEQQRVYTRVKEEFELELNSGEILELQYIVQQFTKLLQISDGFYYADEQGLDGKVIKRPPINLPSGKLNALRSMLDTDEIRRTPKIVLWGVFNHELSLIRDLAVELGYHGVMFWKHTLDRKAARAQFRDDAQCQLFIGQAASGIGMNELKVADTVLYFSRSTKLIHRLQSEDRTHRKGSEIHDSIKYVDFIVPNTVDAKVYDMLRKHKDVADMIVDGKVVAGMLN